MTKEAEAIFAIDISAILASLLSTMREKGAPSTTETNRHGAADPRGEIVVDPRIVPWSYAGSYLCIAAKSGQNGRLTPNNDYLYLISHHWPSGLPLFSLRPLEDPSPPTGFPSGPSQYKFRATPSSIVWSYGNTVVAEATFVNPSTVRFRGSIPFAFDTEAKLAVEQWRCWLFKVPGRMEAEFNSTPNTALRFVALSGRLDLYNDAPSQDNNRRVIVSGDAWDLLVTERDDQKPIQKAAFAADRQRMADDFERYAAKLLPWSSTPTDRYAAYVLWTSTVRPSGYFNTESILMSKLWMNKVWSWDNCFNGLALAVDSPEKGLQQIMVPFDYITAEGRLPDSICHSEILFDYTKPPIYGWTLDTMEELGVKLSHSQLERFYRGVARFTDFWYLQRSTNNSKLPWYSHGNDSGWDNSTAYDQQTICVSPDLAALLVTQTDMLFRVAGRLGFSGQKWASLRDETLKALINELWDDENETFCFADAFNGRRWTSDTLLKYVPLVASTHLPRRINECMARHIREHLTEWGLATETPSSKLYEPDGYWRGPIWAPPTLMIETGLRRAGFDQLADEVSDKFVRLCEKTGFAENYDALTGAGNRDLSYTWSASAYLVLRARAERRK